VPLKDGDQLWIGGGFVFLFHEETPAPGGHVD
jgi:hypothetical protein